jgi:hypothetical protein
MPPSLPLRPHPERASDVETLNALHHLCNKSHVTTVAEGYGIVMSKFAKDAPPVFDDITVLQMDFRMEATVSGIRPGVRILAHRVGSKAATAPLNFEYAFEELGWPCLRELHEAHLVYSVSCAGLGGKGRPSNSLRGK